MLTPAQCRAARGFLNWTLADLAAASGLSRASLNSFEGGNGNPKTETLARVRTALEKQGVEFTDEPGVRMKGQRLEVRRYEGADAVRKLHEDILATCIISPSEILFSNLDESAFTHTPDDQTRMLQQIQSLRQHGIQERVIMRNGDRFFTFPPSTTTYRWIDDTWFGLVPAVVYGDKHAIIFWGSPIVVVITENSQVAQMYRQQFELLWSVAKPIPFTEPELMAFCEQNLPGSTHQ